MKPGQLPAMWPYQIPSRSVVVAHLASGPQRWAVRIALVSQACSEYVRVQKSRLTDHRITFISDLKCAFAVANEEGDIKQVLY